MHGLNNLIQNAVQFAHREVSVTTFWTRRQSPSRSPDDGPGFPLHLLGRIGEPYISTRAGAADHMGLGIFIAQSLLERSGARLVFDNLRKAARMLRFSGIVPIWRWWKSFVPPRPPLIPLTRRN